MGRKGVEARPCDRTGQQTPQPTGDTRVRYDPSRHRRQSLRLKGYDYTQPGAYFVTICVRDRECALGEVVGGEMVLSDAGYIVRACWGDLPNHYPHVQLDAFVIMPNHMHGVIVLLDDVVVVGAGLRPAPTRPAPAGPASTTRPAPTIGPAPTTRPAPTTTVAPKRHGLSEIVRAFKSFSARRINALHDTAGTPFWQRGFYERIVRSDRALDAIRQYTIDNPAHWAAGRNNPSSIKQRG